MISARTARRSGVAKRSAATSGGIGLPEAVHSVVAEIAGRFRPYRVILFGSYARGESHADSDVDLLVIMETRKRPLHAAAEVAAAVAHPLPLDILVYRPLQWQAAVRSGTAFASQVQSEGIVLYEG